MPKGLEVTVDMRNLIPVKETIRVLSDMLYDERVPAAVRSEYRDRWRKATDWKTNGLEEGYVIGASSLEEAERIARAHGLHHKCQWVYAYAGIPARQLKDGLWVASEDRLLGEFKPEERAQLTAHLI
ncbi:hypothetical protein P4H27_09945 [Paenibacillus taichungensis]|uniref:hypothetical protein n=1 Tax=Paenibacillus taichungensis TaxID=484184 RepID=UPI002DB9DF6B|nr:hypothetical protein [Paenibacillus taichungensis]MEC0107257.1 hypothetical protein [Paenibacillus taichungensis]MEC0194811.1 hypothetical protein [Paenibacillus taichungensis]